MRIFIMIVSAAFGLAFALGSESGEGKRIFSEIASTFGMEAVFQSPEVLTASKASASPQTSGPGVPYDRDLYNHWIDEDGDCINMRHEMLISLSTGPVTMNDSGCLVSRGRWNDPYTGQIYTNARDLDVDHMVPLAWAHVRGGHSWSHERREAFANDQRNLFAVQASANRSKGAKGPTEWLPPNETYHCEYVLRFTRIVLIYDLKLFPGEADEINQIRDQVCEGR